MTMHQPTAAQTAPSAHKPDPSGGDLLPLENGDRLTRAEFERRYEAMPYLKKTAYCVLRNA